MALVTAVSWGQFYDGSNVEYGKNRVQHRTFEWQYLPTSRAEVYYYQGGKAYANRITAEVANCLTKEKLLNYGKRNSIQHGCP